MCWNADGTPTSWTKRQNWLPIENIRWAKRLETHRWTRWSRKDNLHSWFEHVVMNLAPTLKLNHAACRWAIKRALKRL